MPPNRQREDPDVSLIPSWCEELRAARLARDWSEDDLADQIQNWEYRHGAGRHLGVSRSYVSEWETGKRGVSRDYAIRIEGVTGIPRDHFIDHRSSRGRVVRLQEAEVGLHWTDDLDDAVEVLIELWRCRLDRREFLVAMAATAVTSEVALRWLVSPPEERLQRDTGAGFVGHSDIEALMAAEWRSRWPWSTCVESSRRCSVVGIATRWDGRCSAPPPSSPWASDGWPMTRASMGWPSAT